MANTDRPYGAEPAGRVLSMNYYAHGTAAALYPGDFAIMNSSGLAVVATAGSTELIGVSAEYVAAAGTSVLIMDDPDQQYWIQDDGAGGTLAATSVGLNADIVATAGNSTYLRSRHELDTNTAVTGTFQLRILGKHPDDSWLDNVRCRVVVNESHHAKKLVGI